jgi:hypothetical protein
MTVVLLLQNIRNKLELVPALQAAGAVATLIQWSLLVRL